MKLHRIEVENLNSLYGRQVLDLDTELAEAPMFLIHGRTGAGKSTLLDAVCLALFGQTPRLGKGRGDEEQDPRQIMSRGTGRCSSTVEFSLRLQEGRRRYRATWTCWRAREKPGEALQQPVRKLEVQQPDERGAIPWFVLIESRLEKDFKPHFDKALLELTVEDFKRSILLAQGEFAAFLRASETERSNMLERLTDTSQYANIGRRAGEVYRKQRAAQERLRDRLSQIPVLSEPEVMTTRADLTASDVEICELTQRTNHLELGIRWAEEHTRRLDALRSASEVLQQVEREREAARLELERLAEDARCQPAARLLNDVQFDERELSALTVRISETSTQVAALETQVAAQQADLTLAADALVLAVAAVQEAAPRVQAARALRLAASAAMKEARAAEQQSAAAAAQLTELRSTQERAQRAHDEQTRRWQAARATLADSAEAEGLADQIPAWQAEVERVRTQIANLKNREKSVQNLMRTRADKQTAFEVAKRATEAAHDALVPLTEARETTRAQLAGVLGVFGSVREARGALARSRELADGRIRLLDRLIAPMQAVERTAAQWTALRVEHDEAQAELSERQRALPPLRAVEQARADQRSAADEALRARRLVLDLVSKRDALREGAPCPLCGSPEHPWHGLPLDPGAVTAAADAEAALAAADAALGAAREACTSVATQVARIATQIEKQTPKLRAAQRDFEAAVRALDEAVVQAALVRRLDALQPAGVEDALGELRARCQPVRAELDGQLGEVRAALEALDLAEAAAHATDARWVSASEGLATLERTRDRAGSEAERAAEAAAREDQARAELAAEVGQARDALAAALRQSGLSPRDGELRLAVEEAARRVGAWRASVGAELEAREGLRAAEVQRASAESAVVSAAQLAVERQHSAAQRRAEASEASARAEAALDGKHPDLVEDELATRQKQAEIASQAAQQVANRSRQTQAALSGRLGSDLTRREELQTRLDANRLALDAQLHALGIADLDGLAARLLTPERRSAIGARERALHAAHTAALTRHADANAALSTQEATRPEAAPADAEALAGARTELDAWRTRQATALQQKGALLEKLSQHDQNLQRVGSLAAELEIATHELNLWERIYDLIGVGNGDAFKKYAQILNLEDLLHRANERLRWLAPRYLLVPARGPNDEERLAFAVQDEHHAWEARPLTTLSGGETFLVSLSLALALAEYRTLQAPIETLLLDEGFGTLDTDTLNTVMDALERLQSRGARVGLISHVDGLRERIEARVAVETVGHGRSRIRVELGAGLRVA